MFRLNQGALRWRQTTEVQCPAEIAIQPNRSPLISSVTANLARGEHGRK